MTDSNTTADTAFEKAKAEETTLAATESANDEVTTDAESHNKKRKTEENYIQCFNNEMKQMSRTGMDWYYANETAQRDIKRLQEEVAAKDADLARMREADDKNRTTIQVNSFKNRRASELSDSLHF
jgi:chromosome segregation ATPase